MEASQRDQAHNLSHSSPSNNINLPQGQGQHPDLFAFLKAHPPKSPSFFSDNGLGQDIIQVTQAEPDICLEVFYALYHTLRPQIEKQSDVSFRDAWTNFIGGSVIKGSLCPPEKLITEKRVREIKNSLSSQAGENKIFQYLDQVIHSTSHLKEKIVNSPGQILQKEEFITSLNLVEQFYLGFRNQMTTLVQKILEKEKMNASSTSESDELEHLLEPKAIMMSDIFSQHWAYRISRNKAEKILSLDTHGRNLQSNLNDPANHRVISFPENAPEPLVFFKANGNPPIQPEKEFMLFRLYRHLQIPVPETALLVLTDVFEKNSEYFYAVQASEAVIGESALKACQDPETIFDQEAYVSQFIGALLTNPSDGSFKNFKYSPAYETLITIDNDLVFKPDLTSENAVNVKSILYLLSQMDLPCPNSIKTFFTTLDPHLTIFAWLQDLSKKNTEYSILFRKMTFQKTRCIYQNLLPQSETPSLSPCLEQKVSVDPELHGEPFHPQVLVSRSLLNSLIEKFQTIEKILLKKHPVSTQTLFEEISPILGKYYRKLRLEFDDPQEALEALWGDKKNGVDYSSLSFLLDHEELSSLPKVQNELDGNQPPRTFFQEYKEKLISEDSSDSSALDRFIRRHNERKRKNTLNLRAALKELQFLIQEGLTNSQRIREIIDFIQSLSKIVDNNPHLIKEITSLLHRLPHPELKWLFNLEKYFLRLNRNVPKDLVPSSTPVLGALMKQRTFLLSKSENQYLFDNQGDICKNPSLTGRSRVTCFPENNPEFYLKQYPEWPGYEFASTLFMRLLGVTQLPYQDLVVLKDYPVLLTQKVHGDPVLRIWHNSQAFHNLDPVHTGLLIISAMLINPEDGKEDNFILSPDGRYLIPIDSDHCFLPSFFQKEGSFWNAFTVNTALQTKTLLFCLDEMYMPIPLEVRKHILSLNFDFLLTQWITELDKLENQLNNLIDQNQRSRFLKRGTVMRIPFYKQFIQNMHWKVHKIQNTLNSVSEITPFDLLKAIEPFVAKCYQDSFNKGSDLQTRFKAATDQLYTKNAIDGSRMSILNTRTMMEIVHISEEELQKDVAFLRMGPVDALEYLNQLIQEQTQKAIVEQEMLCELDDKNQEKKWISLFGNSTGEANLKAFLANPKEGLVLKGSKLITSSKLAELFTQTPDKGMRIRFLSLPGSPLLTNKEIRLLTEECPNLEYLNVSGCLKLKQIFIANGKWPLLGRLEAKDCLNLEKFVSYSPIKILQIETDRKIDIFVEKFTLDIFTISKKTNKFYLFVKRGEGFQITFQDQTVIHDRFIQNILSKENGAENYFGDIKATIGKYLISAGKDLAIFVTVLNLRKSNLGASDIQKIVKLNLLNLKELNLSENKKMGIESFKHLIQADWPKLNHLDLSDNLMNDKTLKILAQGNWPLLETLNLTDTGVTKKGLTNFLWNTIWPNLKSIGLNGWSSNFVNGLFKKNWHLIEELDLSSCRITRKEIHLLLTL